MRPPHLLIQRAVLQKFPVGAHILAAAAIDYHDLVIAHRLSTITGADQIVVVNGGRSQDVGTHGELLKNCPLYQEMWRAHMGAKEGEQA